jgi:hypothetical protein
MPHRSCLCESALEFFQFFKLYVAEALWPFITVLDNFYGFRLRHVNGSLSSCSNERAYFQPLEKSLEVMLGQIKSEISNKCRVGRLGGQWQILPRRIGLSIRWTIAMSVD